MTALGPSEISARRRPFVVLGVAIFRLFFGFLLAWPLSSLIASSGVGFRSEGDRALFEGGGYLLLELLRLQGGSLLAAARGLLPLLGLALVLTSACNVTLLVALDIRDRLTSLTWLSRAWTRLPAQLVIGAGATLAQLALGVLALIALDAVPEQLARPMVTTAGQVAILLVMALLAGAVGGFADVSRASLVRHEASLSEGLARAWSCTRRRPLRACFGWSPYAALFVILALLVAQLTEALDVSQPGAWRLVGVFVAHQLVILLSVACRAAWYARALRLVATDSGA